MVIEDESTMKVTVISRQPITGVFNAYKRSRGNKCSVEKLQSCIKRKEWNLLGHAQITFGIEGISRACSHQLVRHFSNAFTQQSQRHVDPIKQENWFVTPPSIKNTELYSRIMKECAENYRNLLESGIPKEDARFVLPNATKTELTMSSRLRDLWHFLEARRAKNAQWEIRELANKILKLVQNEYPEVFQDRS
jgi:thymidylate synthase (FAD)